MQPLSVIQRIQRLESTVGTPPSQRRTAQTKVAALMTAFPKWCGVTSQRFKQVQYIVFD
ncbi:unnamed protein product [Staurois parvus]|uniref:Uncharacterized protein n=1 Tax=Staurois parvus TaxID=386267 RepID=A0ABN9F0Y3_9NEOB|nr:unnamed protein product [Staurois parvus]